MIDPVNEGLAYQRNIRSGMMSLSEALRERGYNPETVLTEIAADNKRLDALGIILDSDPRNVTQAGQLQGEALAATQPDPPPAAAPVADPDPPARGLHLASSDGLSSGYQVQTMYGYYPDGTWGHASYHQTADEAIERAREHSDCRVLDLATQAIIWPKVVGL
jgi:hypothetical protein